MASVSWARFVALCVVALAFGPSLAYADASSSSQALRTRLQQETDAGRFNGVAIISTGDDVLLSAGFGTIDLDGAIANADTNWRISSISKQIVAVLVMQEVEAGRLSLNDNLGALLPAFTQHAASQVTVRQLLMHTSGLANSSDTPLNAVGVPQFYTTAQADHHYCAGPVAAPAGGFSYNNCDYYLLADILQAKTGQSFAQLLQAHLVVPLGLHSLHPYAPDEREPFVAHDLNGVAEPAIQISSYEAAAGLSMSANDLLKFDRALMDGQLLNADSLAQLWAGEPSLGYVALGAWSYNIQPSGCAAPLALVERRGSVGNVATLNLLWPERNAAIVIFSNTDTDWGQLWQDSGLMRDLVVAAWCS